MHALSTEFVRLLRASGWSQAEAARRLRLTPSAVSLYVSGQARPSATVVQLFKLMMGDRSPLPGEPEGEDPRRAPVGSLDAVETALVRELRGVREPERQRLTESFTAIASLVGEGEGRESVAVPRQRPGRR